MLACIMVVLGTEAVAARPAIAFDRSQAPGRMAELHDRVVESCLTPKRKYLPLFQGLDEMNFESRLVTAYMHETGLQEHVTDRGGSPDNGGPDVRKVMDALAKQVVEYAGQQRLDAFQRACLAQCVGYQWYKDTPENAPSAGDITMGEGNCRHSTYLASFMHEKLGTPDRKINNGVSEMWRGIGHTFSEVNVGGLDFVLNNNWGSDAQAHAGAPMNLCVFRFTRSWEGHNACRLFRDPELNQRYYRRYAESWSMDRDPLTGLGTPFTGPARSCSSTGVTVSGARISAVLVRDPSNPATAAPFNKALPQLESGGGNSDAGY